MFHVAELKFGPYTLENVVATVPAEGETAYPENGGYRIGSAIREQKVVGCWVTTSLNTLCSPSIIAAAACMWGCPKKLLRHSRSMR